MIKSKSTIAFTWIDNNIIVFRNGTLATLDVLEDGLNLITWKHVRRTGSQVYNTATQRREDEYMVIYFSLIGKIEDKIYITGSLTRRDAIFQTIPE